MWGRDDDRNEPRFELGPIGKFGLFLSRRLWEASSFSGLAYLISTVWPHAAWLALACAVLAIVLPERRRP